MKLAIMQPYFMPYIGYFSLIRHCDEFIIFDTPQFMRKGWIERNRIIKLGGGSSYIKVPLIKAPLHTPINEMEINNNSDWKGRIQAQLEVYKNKAPYFGQIKKLFDEIFSTEYSSIVDLNEKALIKVCEYLKIETPIKVFSKLYLDIEIPSSPDEWALNICKSLGASEYINAPGGKSFFDVSKYEKENINIKFLEHEIVEYGQLTDDFEPGLSIVDLLMHRAPEDILSEIDCSLLVR